MLKKFTKQYSLSKTLRFELKPVGETADYLKSFKSNYLKSVIEQDKKRDENYHKVKEIIDRYHRDYIEERLSNPVNHKTGEVLISAEDFEEAFCYYQRFKKNPSEGKKDWQDMQKGLRKKLAKTFADKKSKLFGKELIKNDLPKWLQERGEWEENRAAVESFNQFTTYFTGFNQNRENMYVSDDKSTAIAFRVINENLPRFFANCDQYTRINSKYSNLAFQVENELIARMGVTEVGEIFQPRYFPNLFTQSGIDNFQELLGGRTEEKENRTGINQQINLYRQKHNEKSRNLPNFIPLYKQILSDRISRSFIPESFESDKELLVALARFVEKTWDNGLIESLEKSVACLADADLTRTFVKNGRMLSDLSQSLFQVYSVIPAAIACHAKNAAYPLPTSGKTSEALLKKRESFCKQDIFTLADLDSWIVAFIDTLDADDPLHVRLQQLPAPDKPVSGCFLVKLQQAKDDISQAVEQTKYLFSLDELSKNRRQPDVEKDKGGRGFRQVQKIQHLLDCYLALSHIVKPLHLVKGRKSLDVPDVDAGFYGPFVESYEDYNRLTVDIYNKTRNHLTQKPFSKDKIKVNFEAPTLLNGWDINKETDNKSVILRRDGKYYLAVMHPKHNKIFKNSPKPENGGLSYEKLNYKLLSGANKMLPKVFFSKKGLAAFQPPQEILVLYKNNEHKKGKTFSIKSCRKLIDFFKASIPKYQVRPDDEFGWDVFNYDFSPTDTYRDLSDFYREVEAQGYKLWFSNVSADYIDRCVAEEKLFLFQVYNKDFSEHSKGKPNLHTMYWLGLFSPENLQDAVLKLNGEAEIFYRHHSIKKNDRIFHPADKPICNKNENNPKIKSNFPYDIIKDRRFTRDTFHFHVPITLNFKTQGVNRFNDKINRELAARNDTHVIGIDRGERHLLYYTVINSRGEIIEQDTLNKIHTDKGYHVDYQQKLHRREKERDKARKSWTTVENIKELKKGYLSHVVHRLARLIVKYNAVVCLEDLNFGFKRGRFKVEKQVYQKFERALINKLNYLVFKDAVEGEPGHYRNAYQLTAPFVSFEKLGKQSGILFYVRADFTSKIDPVTGFVDFLRPKYESLAKSKLFFEELDGFCFDRNKDYFEFTFDYKKFAPGRKFSTYPTRWTACTHGDIRYHNRRNSNGRFETREINVTLELKTLFAEQGIDYQSGADLRAAIAGMKETKFYKKLFWLLRLTLTLRHSRTGTDDDFILSPIADENGSFFDSRKADAAQPKDADANGAYHIALKGLWNLQKIAEHDWQADKPGRLNLNIKNEEWLAFSQRKIFKKGR